MSECDGYALVPRELTGHVNAAENVFPNTASAPCEQRTPGPPAVFPGPRSRGQPVCGGLQPNFLGKQAREAEEP